MEHLGSNTNKSELIALFLREKKVKSVYLLSGGMIAFIVDSIFKLGGIKLINVRHEQAAGFAAEGATRVSGVPNVALATSGPGATNLITSIASSFFDSVPTIFITGQVNQGEIKTSKLQRQNGFQELDIVNMIKDITKHSIRINSNHDLYLELDRAWNIAIEGRPGPVLIDIPIDVQQEKIQNQVIPSLTQESPTPVFDSSLIDKLICEIGDSKAPLILLGGGARISKQVEQIRSLINAIKIPTVFSLMGVDILESSSEFRIGMIGTYGNRWANQALAKCDLLIVLGSRLDVRQTGNDILAFSKDKKIFRVDIDQNELMGRVKADININVNLVDFIERLSLKDIEFDFTDWKNSILSSKLKFPQKYEQVGELALNPDDLMKWISTVSLNSNGFIVDVGQHQMWAAQSLQIGNQQRFITSGGLGSMGFALPAAIGAAIETNSYWTVITGDGCSQLSLSELQTVKHYNLPLVICIINNNQHGMVAQFQESNLDSRYIATRNDYTAPDFMKISTAFGIFGIRFEKLADLEKSTELVKAWNKGPIILEFMVSNDAKALPKLGNGGFIGDL